MSAMTKIDLGKKKVFSNFIWSFAERFGAQGVSLIVSFVIARKLDPEIFGIVALILVFINILQIFVDSGFGSALIQKKDADDLDFSTVFYFNVFFCILFYVLIYFLAPIISDFYDKGNLTIYIRVLSICILVYGVKNIQHTYVAKNLMFKRFFFSTLGGTIAAAVVGIVLAYKGYGIWAIVLQHLVNVTIDTIILWITVKWRPIIKFSFSRLKKMYLFGWKILAANAIDCLFIELKNLLVGKVFSSADLGLFNRGEIFPKTIVSNIDLSIDSVLFPVLSNYQDRREDLKNIVKRAITTSVFFMAPLMIGLAVIAPQVIKIILTDKWLPCVPYLRVFCVTYLFYPIHTANLNAIKAVGRSDLFLKLEVYKIAFSFLFLIISIRYGLMAMSYSLIVSSFVCQIINAWPNRKLIGYGYLKQLRDIFPYILCALVMGAAIFGLSFINLPIGIILSMQIIIGGAIYYLECMLFKLEGMHFLHSIIKSVFIREKKNETIQ